MVIMMLIIEPLFRLGYTLTVTRILEIIPSPQLHSQHWPRHRDRPSRAATPTCQSVPVALQRHARKRTRRTGTRTHTHTRTHAHWPARGYGGCSAALRRLTYNRELECVCRLNFQVVLVALRLPAFKFKLLPGQCPGPSSCLKP
jgi:hypothetical protein